MADKRRFELFAQLIVESFDGPRVFDVAGGMGKLNEALTQLGRTCTTFDVRHKRLPVRYCERIFTLDEPCEADVVVGMHADGATRGSNSISAIPKPQVTTSAWPTCVARSMPTSRKLLPPTVCR